MTRREFPGLSPFYPIVPDAAWVARLAGLGAGTIQLRIKDKASADIRREIVGAMTAAIAAGCQLIVNDHWREAVSVGSDYIHLGQDDLARADIATLKAAGIRIGISTHDTAELAIALAAEPDYIALGPIFPTTAKHVGHAPQGLAQLGAWRRRIGELPLVAIGGINLDRAAAVRAAGADVIAVITDIVAASDPDARTLAWLDWATGPRP